MDDLKAEQDSGSSEDSLPGTDAAEPTVPPETVDFSGRKFGRYLLLEKLGHGGMGVVYKAYDPQLDRRVALKVLRIKERSQEADDLARERLLREAQALAQLNHPNVVAVYDAGTIDADIFIAMEYVEGQTLREWLKEKQPAYRQIVEAMIAAGRGIAAAHAAGLVHRDIKPANIIVGNDGRVRVLDFGLARSLSLKTLDSEVPYRSDSNESDGSGKRPASEESLTSGKRLKEPLTLEGHVMGTPGYMAPEQYLGGELNPLTDQFSFCVTLYEALYGKKPYTAKSYRTLRYKVSIGQIDPTPEDSAVPVWLRRIVQKGLSGKQVERYPSLNELLLALAKDPRVFWRRLLVVAAVGTVVLAALLLAVLALVRRQELCAGFERKLAGVWDEAVREQVRTAFLKTDRFYAGDSFGRVSKVLDGYAAAWAGMMREACEATKIRGEQSDKLMDLRMRCLNRRLSEARALTEVFATRADAQVLDRAVLAALGLIPLGQCADEQALLADVPPPEDPEKRKQVEAIRKRLDEAAALEKTGKYQDGLKLAQQAQATCEEAEYKPVTSEALYQVGRLLEKVGKFQEAEQSLRKATKLADAADHDKLRAMAQNDLIKVVGFRQANFGEAEKIIEAAGLVIERIKDEGEIKARWLNNAGVVLYSKGDYDGALTLYERALEIREKGLGPEHPDVAASHTNIGIALKKKGDYDRALTHYERALKIQEKTLGPEHPDAAASHNNIGNTFYSKGDYDKALAHQERALEIREKVLGPDHPDVASSHNNIGLVFYAKGDYPWALERYEKALRMREKALGPDHPDVAMSFSNIGLVFYSKGECDQALAHLERALKNREAALGPEHPDIISTLTNIGSVFLEKGDLARALAHDQRALAIAEKVLGPRNPQLAAALAGLGQITLRRGDPGRASEFFERVLAICGQERCKGEDRGALADAQFGLARVLWGAGAASAGADRPRALQLAREAVVAYQTSKSVPGRRSRQEAEAWLRVHETRTE